MVVVNAKVADEQPSTTLIEVNLNGAVFHFDHPEYVVRVDVDVEVMNLLREICRPHRASVQVKSNKNERTVMWGPVDTDELALAEAHVRLVRKRCRIACGSVRSGPTTPDMRQSHEAVEVGDL